MDVREVLAHLPGAAGVASSAQLQAAGVSRSQLHRAAACGQVARLLPRVYGLAPLPAWPPVLVRDGVADPQHLLHVHAVLLCAGPGACAGGRTAAAVRGWGLLDEPVGEVDLLVPHGRSRLRVRRGRVRQRRGLAAELIVPAPGLPVLRVLDPVDTVLDCCASLPLVAAVVVLDSALRARAVTLDQVRAALREPGRARRRQRVLRVLQLCDPEAGSVLESVLRVRFHLAGLTGWTTQRVVRDDRGRHVLRADFCFEAARVVVEVDGSRWHQDRARDQGTDNALAACGWRVLRFTWAQVVHDPARVLEQVRRAIEATPGFQVEATRLRSAA